MTTLRDEGVPNTYNAIAQRRAVLVSLFGPTAPLKVRKCANIVSALWARRVNDLLDSAWEDNARWLARFQKNRESIRRCRPTFVVVDAKWRSCRNQTVCPFCWARNVGIVYDKVAWALFEDPRHVPAERRRHDTLCSRYAPFDLVERVLEVPPEDSQFRLTLGERLRLKTKKWSKLPFLIRERLDEASDNEFGRRADFYRARELGALGAYEHMAIGHAGHEYDEEEDALADIGRWDIRFRQLLVVPHRWSDRTGRAKKWLNGAGYPARWKRIPFPSKRDVALAVGRCLAYDPLMLRGDIHRARQVLGARETRHLTASFGVFRRPRDLSGLVDEGAED